MDSQAILQLQALTRNATDPVLRLQGLWASHLIGILDETSLLSTLAEPDEYLRAWAIQLAGDTRAMTPRIQQRVASMAVADRSPVVRMYIASAIQRLPAGADWTRMAEALARHGEDREDRNIPLLLWQSIAPRMAGHLEEMFHLAARTQIPWLAEFIHWYAVVLDPKAAERAVAGLETIDESNLEARLSGLALATAGRTLELPPAWPRAAIRLRASSDPRVRRLTDELGAAFGDTSQFPRLRTALANRSAPPVEREHALAVLGRGPDIPSLPLFLELIEEPALRKTILPVLARIDSPAVPATILRRFDSFALPDQAAALDTLTRRPSFARALLSAVSENRFKRDRLTAFHIRQLTQLKDPEIDQTIAATWGRTTPSPAEKLQLIDRFEKTFNEAPLWAYDGRAGRDHFQRLCASCHRFRGDGIQIGPELTGAEGHGIRYFLENIVDPDAVVGIDFQMTTLETRTGDVVSGLVTAEDNDSLTLRTTTESIKIQKLAVARRTPSNKSLMPAGLLESLTNREQLELLKYLTDN